jgi:hypothetical protein
MMLLSFSDYVPVSDLVKIILVTLAVAIVAPSAVSLAVAGLDRRSAGDEGSGDVLVALGAGVLGLLVVVGIYAMVQK